MPSPKPAILVMPDGSRIKYASINEACADAGVARQAIDQARKRGIDYVYSDAYNRALDAMPAAIVLSNEAFRVRDGRDRPGGRPPRPRAQDTEMLDAIGRVKQIMAEIDEFMTEAESDEGTWRTYAV